MQINLEVMIFSFCPELQAGKEQTKSPQDDYFQPHH